MKVKIKDKILKELNEVTQRSNFKLKCGAIIVKNNKVVSCGFAHYPTKKAKQLEIVVHAEEAAIMQALNTRKETTGSDIYVLLIRKNGEVRYNNAYCCPICSRLLVQSNVANVIYPTPSGWSKVSVRAMFNRSLKRIETEEAFSKYKDI
jgi:deoxycytidylate deaminase